MALSSVVGIGVGILMGTSRAIGSLMGMPEFGALLIILFAFAFIASEAVAYFERKVSFYASSR